MTGIEFSVLLRTLEGYSEVRPETGSDLGSIHLPNGATRGAEWGDVHNNTTPLDTLRLHPTPYAVFGPSRMPVRGRAGNSAAAATICVILCWVNEAERRTQ